VRATLHCVHALIVADCDGLRWHMVQVHKLGFMPLQATFFSTTTD